MNENSLPTYPRSVEKAERLLWWLAAITGFLTFIICMGLLTLRHPVVTVLSNLVRIAFLCMTAAKIGEGRNWARWLFLFVSSIDFIIKALTLVLMPQVLRSVPPFLLVVTHIGSGIELWALILMFRPESRVWFRPTAKAAQ
jgi:hypothetical protein